MTTILSALKITLAAAVLAGGLATAVPAMAQSGEPSSNFSIGIGGGGQQQMLAPEGQGQMQMGSPGLQYEDQQGNNFRRGGGYDGGFNLCLSNREVIRGIRDYGFKRVEIVDSSRRRAEVIGRWGRWDYLMGVNKCTGEVNILDRFRRGGYNTGFGLQFNFN